MSNIYKEVFLVALTGHCMIDRLSESQAVNWSKQVADYVADNQSLMAKLADDAPKEIPCEPCGAYTYIDVPWAFLRKALELNKSGIRDKIMEVVEGRKDGAK